MLSKAGQAERPPSARLARPWLDPLAKPSLRVAGVSKRFGALRAVDDVSLDIHRGELFALLGGSGCGKTTLLRIMAGFVIPEAGSLTLDGQDLLALPPYDRPVSMMFQSYALFPHMSVFDNVAFGLRRDRVPRNEIAVRVKQALDLVQMDGLAHRKPAQLSGGQRQRVALARSIVKRPKVLLLDEPLSALDRKLREATQFELVNIQEEVGITFVMVTHDQEEAMTMATRIAVMDHGRVVQVGTPGEVYDLPRSRFVADFIGAVNLFDGTLRDADGTASRIDCPALGAPILVAGAVRTGEAGSACIAVRPERMRLGPADLPLGLANEVTGQVRDMAYLGDCRVYQVAVASGKLVKVTEPATRGAAVDAFGRDQTVRVGWPADAGISVEP